MDIRSILMGCAFALMWSSAFTSARIIVTNAPPLTVSAVRFLIAGVITLIIARAIGQSFRLSAAQWRLTAIFGICQNALYLGLNFVAMQTVEASVAAIVASTLPLWVALVGWVAFRDRVGALGILGLMGGFLGVALIMGTRLGSGGDSFGILLCFIGVFALTLATLSVRGATAGGNLFTVVGYQMLIGSAALAVPAAFETHEVVWSATLLIAIAYSILVAGVVATVVWFLLVNRVGAVRAASFHFLNPFFGVAIAALLLNEELGPLDTIGVIVVSISIVLVQRDRLTNR